MNFLIQNFTCIIATISFAAEKRESIRLNASQGRLTQLTKRCQIADNLNSESKSLYSKIADLVMISYILELEDRSYPSFHTPQHCQELRFTRGLAQARRAALIQTAN